MHCWSLCFESEYSEKALIQYTNWYRTYLNVIGTFFVSLTVFRMSFLNRPEDVCDEWRHRIWYIPNWSYNWCWQLIIDILITAAETIRRVIWKENDHFCGIIKNIIMVLWSWFEFPALYNNQEHLKKLLWIQFFLCDSFCSEQNIIAEIYFHVIL